MPCWSWRTKSSSVKSTSSRSVSGASAAVTGGGGGGPCCCGWRAAAADVDPSGAVEADGSVGPKSSRMSANQVSYFVLGQGLLYHRGRPSHRVLAALPSTSFLSILFLPPDELDIGQPVRSLESPKFRKRLGPQLSKSVTESGGPPIRPGELGDVSRADVASNGRGSTAGRHPNAAAGGYSFVYNHNRIWRWICWHEDVVLLSQQEISRELCCGEGEACWRGYIE
jgi:hypothetical protein